MQKEDYAYLYELEEKFWWFVGMREITASVLDRYCPPRERKILDAGCGTGGNLAWLKRYVIDDGVHGIDLVDTALAFCRERDFKNLAQASATDLPFADESFDMVTSFDVLVQIPGKGADEKAIREMYRVLKTGGVAFIRVAAYKWMLSGHDKALGTQRRYSLSEITGKIERAGFKVLRSTYANTLPFPLALIRRLFLKRIGLSDRGSDVKPLSPRLLWIDTLLRRSLLLEARLLKNQKVKLPFGLSAICIAEKE